ncbi:hypothetical protein [Paludisphaera sp.]|uniref:hypothetical protein n=1 Tax=Paludisphaera sp. TaxID=2017432 RepID=UPI00301D19FC
MDSTFRPRKSDLYTAIGLTPLFLAWGGATLWLAGNDPAIPSPAGFAALSAVPFFMAALCAWTILDHRRSSLSFRGSRVVRQGVLKRTEMDLADATGARWIPGRLVKIRDASSRLSIRLDEYEKADREAIVAGLRAAIPPDVQRGWDLFAYKTRFGLPEKRTPDPGEVLRTRRDSLRVYLMVAAASIPAVALASWATGEPSTLFAIPGLLALALGFSLATPKDGEVVPRISWRASPGVVFILAWGGLGLVLISGFSGLWDRLPAPATLAVAVGVAYIAAFVLVMNRFERLRMARDEEAAKRAARERDESGFPSGGVRL